MIDYYALLVGCSSAVVILITYKYINPLLEALMHKLIYKMHLSYLTSRPLTLRRIGRIFKLRFKLARM